jgi:lipopolysaccharide transport system permease protein
MLIPLASVVAVLVDFSVALVVWIVLAVANRTPPTWTLLTLPLLILLVLVTATGVSLGLSALTVYYRDFVHALPFLVQVWMYASPVVYSAEMVPTAWRPVYWLNPMAGIIDGFRWSLLGAPQVPVTALLLAVTVAVLAFVMGSLIFRRIERTFADVI